MTLDLNAVLAASAVPAAGTIVARHQAHEVALRRVLPWLAAERPAVFKMYQQVHWARLEAAMAKASRLISCLAQPGKRALLTGVYEIRGYRRISYDEYWAIPENQELKAHGMQGLAPDGTEPLLFDLELSDELADLRGRLVLSWPGPERSWWRWADRNCIPVASILEEHGLVPQMPRWDELVLTWTELSVLPTSWRAALAEWRGIYFIFDVRREKGYVGSAYGLSNLLGRWLTYAATGHGGNSQLRKSAPEDLRFSILERTSPDMPADEVIRLEGRWKERLHTRNSGLNDN